MNFTALPIFATALSIATVAQAEGTNYLSYGLGYTSISTDDVNLDSVSGGAAIDYTTGAWILSGSFNILNLSDSDDSVRLTEVAAKVGYSITPQAVLYGGVDYISTEDFDQTMLQAGGETMFGAVTAGLNYADSEDFDDGIYSLYGSYQVSNASEAGIAFSDLENDMVTSLTFDYDAGSIDAVALVLNVNDATSIFIDGRYDFGNRIRGLASFANLDGEVTAYRAGAGYEVADNIWLDATVGRIDENGGSGSIDLVGVGISFETGRQTLLIDRLQEVETRAIGSLFNFDL